MTLRQVTVPWIRGYEIGIGVDLASGSPMGLVTEGEVTAVGIAGAHTVSQEVTRIHTTSELESKLGIDVEASYGCGAFGAGIEGRFGYAKSSTIQASSLFMCVMVAVNGPFQQMDKALVTGAATELVGNQEAFAGRYGNMYVRGIQPGGLFVGVMRIETKSSTESEQISATLSGSYGLFSAEASTKFSDVQKKYGSEVSVSMYHEGGPVDLKINDITDPMELMRNANLFLDSFKLDSGAASVPYMVTLSPITTAEGPQPPNLIQVQTAQDVIVQCAKLRSRLLDDHNLVDYIVRHPANYDFAAEITTDTLIEVNRRIEKDLDVVSRCASQAMNNCLLAVMPSVLDPAFPYGSLPNPMPTPKAGAKLVKVPDLSSCTNYDSCRAILVATGLVPVRKVAPVPPEDHWRLFDVQPPTGAEVAEGSTVTVTTVKRTGPLYEPLMRAPGDMILSVGGG